MPDDRPELQFSNAVESDIDEVLDLIETVHGEWPAVDTDVTPRDHLDWKMHSSATSMDRHTIARVDGRIAGVVLRVPRDFIVRGEMLHGSTGADVSLHPDLQGQGLFGRLREFSVQDSADHCVQLHLLTSRHPTVVRAQERGGAIVVANRQAHLFRPTDARRAAQRLDALPRWLPRPVAGPVLRGASGLQSLRHRGSARPSGSHALVTIESFDERVDDLFRRASETFDLIGARTAAFLNWRLCDERAGRFIVRAVFDGGGMLGYCVLKPSTGAATVADLLAVPGREDVARALVADAVDLARAEGADGVSVQLSEQHPYRRAFAAEGFLDTRQRFEWTVNPLTIPTETLAFVRDPSARVHLMLGDSDFV